MAGWTLIGSLLLITCLSLHSAAQTSCKDRCGEPFLRGQICTCDDGCLTYDECCKDYEEACTSRGSCRGRCQEAFRRGRECECDPDCILYNTCCSDYNAHCDIPSEPEVRSTKEVKATGCSAGEITLGPSMDQGPETARNAAGIKHVDSVSEVMPIIIDLLDPTTSPHAIPTKNTLGSGLPHPGDSSPGEPIVVPIQLSLSFSNQAGGAPQDIPAGSELRAGGPSTLIDMAQAPEASDSAALLNETSSPDLCNGAPIDGLTAPFNGSVIVFQGHFFWLIDPKSKENSSARSITAELGIPSPIDTAFTRCNCQKKTYIIKGDDYWSFENGVVESGYPRSVSKDFGGLSGKIVAALSVPGNKKKPEAIYFFKKGGTVQKLTYPAGSTPSCNGKKAKNSVTKNRIPDVRLSGEVNLNLKWKGFPSPVTSALSMPNPKKPDGYEHFVISWPKVFIIRISGEIPVVSSPAKPPAEQNEVRSLLGCP